MKQQQPFYLVMFLHIILVGFHDICFEKLKAKEKMEKKLKLMMTTLLCFSHVKWQLMHIHCSTSKEKKSKAWNHKTNLFYIFIFFVFRVTKEFQSPTILLSKKIKNENICWGFNIILYINKYNRMKWKTTKCRRSKSYQIERCNEKNNKKKINFYFDVESNYYLNYWWSLFISLFHTH